MKENLTIIKVGGKIVEQEDTLAQLLDDFAKYQDIRSWYMVAAVAQLRWLHVLELKQK